MPVRCPYPRRHFVLATDAEFNVQSDVQPKESAAEICAHSLWSRHNPFTAMFGQRD